jgi:hypothetical protein
LAQEKRLYDVTLLLIFNSLLSNVSELSNVSIDGGIKREYNVDNTPRG